MDDPAIDQREHRRALRSLALLNRVSHVEETEGALIARGQGRDEGPV